MPPDERAARGKESAAARELLANYLKTVAFWLPGSEKRDILAELEEEIRAQVEEQEGGLGRALEEREMELLLERWGHPLRVAERYRPRSRGLIGPSVFPLYRAVLKGVLWFYLVPWLLVWAYLVAFVPSYRAAHPGFALIETLGTWLGIALESFAVITVAFALLERSPRALERLVAWKPREPHAPADSERIPRSTSIAELLGSLFAAVVWVSLPLAPLSFTQADTDVRWTSGPLWQDFHRGLFVPVLLLLLGAVGLSGLNLLRPRWTRLRLGLRAALRGAGALLLLSVLLEHRAEIAAQKASAAAAQMSTGDALAAWTNIGVFIGLSMVGGWCAVTCLLHAYRALRWRDDAQRPDERPPTRTRFTPGMDSR